MLANDAGIDAALERWSVRVVDGGEIVVEAEVTRKPEALVAWLRGQPFELARIGPVAVCSHGVFGVEAPRSR